MEPDNNMKIKLILHDENFMPKIQSTDLPKKLENQVLTENKIKSKLYILDRLVK